MKKNAQYVLIIMLTVFMLICITNKAYSRGLIKITTNDKFPGITFHYRNNIVTASFSYGSLKNEIGYIQKYQVESGTEPDLLNTGVDILFIRNGNAYLFDWHNKNIKILDKTYRIIKTISLKNHRQLKGHPTNTINFPFYFDVRYSVSRDKIFIKNKDGKYVNLDIRKGSIDNNGIASFYEGGTIVLLKGDPDYNIIKSQINKIKKENKDYLGVSFDSDFYGNFVFVLLTKKWIKVYKLKDSRLIYNNSIRYNPLELSDYKYKVKVFNSQNKVFVFIFEGWKNFVAPPQGMGTSSIPYGKLVILDKQNFKVISTHLIYPYNWHMFTVYNDTVFTWDYIFRTKMFNIYRINI